MKKYILLALFMCRCVLVLGVEAPKKSTDANIFGHVVDRDTHEHIPYATIAVTGTAFGTTTDASGHYFLKNLPEGALTLEVRALGYASQTQQVTLRRGQTAELNFEVVQSGISMDEVPWWTQRIANGQPVIISSLDELPDEAFREREVLAMQDIKSLIAVPLLSRDKVWGYAGIDIVNRPRRWTGEDFQWFSSLINIISLCIELQRSEREAQSERKYLQSLYHHMPLGYAQLRVIRDRQGKPVDLLVLDTADGVLHDPNSPLRNDEFYIPVLRAQLAAPWYDEYERIAPEYDLRMAMQNRVGQRANDFRYTLASGATGTLYGVKAEYTLLFINNPGCGMCKQLREQISGSPMLSEMIERGRLKILALYPDEDLTEWRNYRDHIPASWINAYDAGCLVRENGTYDLTAIPSLYLLDSDKRVLVKDSTDVPYIEEVIDRRG